MPLALELTKNQIELQRLSFKYLNSLGLDGERSFVLSDKLKSHRRKISSYEQLLQEVEKLFRLDGLFDIWYEEDKMKISVENEEDFKNIPAGIHIIFCSK